ncbi:MAG TPA: 7TM diverse intracellular signaling domain-containing protein [Bacteroidia bacterium]|nr:7TM diverse intracellular signaling domain-containing protein [Bacteroidia bacterium]
MLRKSILVFALLLAPFFLAAQDVVVLKDNAPVTSLVGHYEVFVDSTGNMSLGEVMHSGKFYKPLQPNPNFGITSSAIWARFTLKKTGKARQLFSYGNCGSDSVILYETGGPTTGKQIMSGRDSYRKREFGVNLALFSLAIPADSTRTFYLRVKDVPPVMMVLEAGTEESYFTYASLYNLLNGVFYGIILLMIIYNLFLFFTNRDPVYIYYVVYTLANGLFIAFVNGYLIYFPHWLNSLFFRLHTLAPDLLGLFAMLFTVHFLDIRKNAPRFYKPYLSLGTLVALALVLDIAGRPHDGLKLVQLAGVAFSIASMVVAVIVYRRGYKPARYYILGFGAYLCGLTIFILLDAGVVPYSVFARHAAQVGAAIEAVLLSFAIGDKINRFKKEKEKAQQEALVAAQENERIVREQNVMLERKVEERTAEIRMQKAIIEEKNKDILDSIHYAKRIQRALLASDTLLQNRLPEYFVLYRPKDIVSGDFYWADETPEGKFLLLTGDCTGHGVPGAFMSLLNISITHELTFGHRIFRPDLLLNAQRDAIIMSLNPEGSGEISKDGMDCVLCSYDFGKMQMEFACANNPLWILRNGEMMEFKADKQPIGMHEGPKKEFTLHSVQLQKGDTVYTFTDGFADQFGGPRGKKFKYSQLKELLLSIGGKTMEEQKNILEKTFSDWKGDLEQVDDVLVIGVRI